MIQYLQNGIQGSEVRAFHGEGGWIIEVIHPQLNAQRGQILTQLETLLNNPPHRIQRDIVWKLFVYSSPEERYKGSGTLHTLLEEFDHGVSVVTLAADDTYVDLTEYDCEIISFCNYNGLLLQSRISLDVTGQPILPYVPGAQYRWLETLGGHYGLGNVAPTPSMPGYLNLMLS